jgi:hypothetical protein
VKRFPATTVCQSLSENKKESQPSDALYYCSTVHYYSTILLFYSILFYSILSATSIAGRSTRQLRVVAFSGPDNPSPLIRQCSFHCTMCKCNDPAGTNPRSRFVALDIENGTLPRLALALIRWLHLKPKASGFLVLPVFR